MDSYRLAVVGGGNMGAALVGGLLGAEWAPADIAVVEVLAARRERLSEMFPGVTITDTIPPCRGALIAVKP
ncbi:MAG: pyrroline-5-carboxylate reductase, partial [Actinomycetota bacterium]